MERRQAREYILTGNFLIGAALIHVLSYGVNAVARVDILAEKYTGEIPLWMIEVGGRIGLILLLYTVLRYLAYRKKKSRWSIILMEIWAFIFIVAESFYYVCLAFYNNALSQFQSVASKEAYLNFYNDTHGFKYASLYICIIFGMVLTGYITNARFLSVLSGILIVAFIICFGFIDMQTVQIMGQEVGLVVSSLLFHSVESVGILLIGIWLSLIK